MIGVVMPDAEQIYGRNRPKRLNRPNGQILDNRYSRLGTNIECGAGFMIKDA